MLIRRFVGFQGDLCRRFDTFMPAAFRVNGYHDIMQRIIPQYLAEHMKIYEIGGGKWPYITRNIIHTRSDR